jgi:hypothetical protein
MIADVVIDLHAAVSAASLRGWHARPNPPATRAPHLRRGGRARPVMGRDNGAAFLSQPARRAVEAVNRPRSTIGDASPLIVVAFQRLCEQESMGITKIEALNGKSTPLSGCPS